jgi:mRNA-degrading endonuclease YafQ of YafQ-DinJ toxin-antitoxin module
MAGFDAATAVEPMDYDFTAFGGSKGIVPEPSTKDMKDFQRDFTKVMRKGQQLEVSDDEALKMSEKDFDALQKKVEAVGLELDELIGRLCKNSPSAEEVAKLPFRVKTAFSKWLMEQFAPEGGTSGTKR